MDDQATMVIRNMSDDDTKRASEVPCSSIVELCQKDHGENDTVIKNWVSNKSPEHLKRWLDSSKAIFLVSEIKWELCGVAAFHQSGEILLNYVSPKHYYSGVSKTMLMEMESRLRSEGPCRESAGQIT